MTEIEKYSPILFSSANIETSVDVLKDKCGLFDGFVLTGFIDVDKVIDLRKKKLFIEKKLPFQIMILKIDD